MSDVRIYVHAVWGVKCRQPVLEDSKREILFKHICENAKSKNIEIILINGHVDHVHCLLRLKATQSIAEVIQLVKGEAAWWANKEQLFTSRLIWAVKYFARSVEQERLYRVIKYINNQDKHTKGYWSGDV